MNIKSIGSKIKGNPKMVEGTVYSMLIICSISHFLNDMIQSIIPSIYPIVKDKFDFSFAQIGIITLVFQMTSASSPSSLLATPRAALVAALAQPQVFDLAVIGGGATGLGVAVDAAARFPREAVDAMIEDRLLGIQVPIALGGEGAGFAEIAELCSILGQACSASAMVFAMHHIKLSSLVEHGLDSAWHAGFMRRVASEQLLLASATTEGGIGGNLRNSICAIAVEDGICRLEKLLVHSLEQIEQIGGGPC